MNTHVRRACTVSATAASGLAIVVLSAGSASAATTDPGAPTGPSAYHLSVPLLPGLVGHVNLGIQPCVDVGVGDGHATGVAGSQPINFDIAPGVFVGDQGVTNLPHINLSIQPCI